MKSANENLKVHKLELLFNNQGRYCLYMNNLNSDNVYKVPSESLKTVDLSKWDENVISNIEGIENFGIILKHNMLQEYFLLIIGVFAEECHGY